MLDIEAAKEATKDSKQIKSDVGTHGGSVIVMIVAFLLAIGLFVVLPTYVASLFKDIIRNDSLMAIIEGAIRILVFLIYVIAISLLKDIRRLYMYHGAEHKCINCIEKGRPLTVKNVTRSSRFHKRCGTSFLFLVVFISVILFFFIRVDSMMLKVGIRILMIPVVAGIAYEVLRLAGRYDNFLITILSAPGLWIQRLTTKEPDAHMIRVAIASVEAVFDWKQYLADAYGYEVTDEWLKDEGGITPADKDEDEEFTALKDNFENMTEEDDWEEDEDDSVITLPEEDDWEE